MRPSPPPALPPDPRPKKTITLTLTRQGQNALFRVIVIIGSEAELGQNKDAQAAKSQLVPNEEIGGSDGARTRSNCNARLPEVKALSQILSQDSRFPDDLKEVVGTWSTLTPNLRSAVLAIIRSLGGKSKKEHPHD